MSKRNKQHRSLSDGLNEKITVPSVPPPAVTSAPIQEKQMEAEQPTQSEAPEVQNGPTAKQMAAVEEANAKRRIDIVRRNEQIAEEQAAEPVSLIGTAAKCREALLDQLRTHAQKPAKPPYVPPPMTDRQKERLQEEMNAGAAAVAKAKASQIRQGHPLLPQAGANEGVTNPVHRPNEIVPDPLLTGTGKAGAGVFSPDV